MRVFSTGARPVASSRSWKRPALSVSEVKSQVVAPVTAETYEKTCQTNALPELEAKEKEENIGELSPRGHCTAGLFIVQRCTKDPTFAVGVARVVVSGVAAAVRPRIGGAGQASELANIVLSLTLLAGPV